MCNFIFLKLKRCSLQCHVSKTPLSGCSLGAGSLDLGPNPKKYNDMKAHFGHVPSIGSRPLLIINPGTRINLNSVNDKNTPKLGKAIQH